MNSNSEIKIDEGKETPMKSEIGRLGRLLKNERESKHLDLKEISRKTRLRPHILKALENEDWGLLPSPVFVKGFIRSYADALGINREMALNLYQETKPDDPPIRSLVSKTKKSRKKTIAILAIIALGVMVVLYLWAGHPTSQQKPISMVAFEKNDFKQQAPEPTEEPVKEEVKDSMEKILENAEPTEDTKPAETPLEIPKIETDTSLANDILESTPEPSQVLTSEIDQLSLKMDVREKTWVRIFIDDADPKEFIFSPGSQPEWKASHQFKVMIGNAGGVDIEFNGEQIENLGERGKVVNLILPE